MLGLMPVSEALMMWSADADELGLGLDVADVLDVKRQSPGYERLLAEVRAEGITVPVHVEPGVGGYRSLLDGHHRIAAAIDAGLDMVPWTTVPLRIDRGDF